MKSLIITKLYFLVLFVAVQVIVYSDVEAEIIGLPPYTTIDIPPSAFGDHLDMVQDSNNTLYVASIKGVKIFNGLKWQLLEISENSDIRRLYYDNINRVYVGGSSVLGYIEADKFGQYVYTDISPKDYAHDINEIWYIEECNGHIFFEGLNDIFRFDPSTNELSSWHFKSKLGALNCYQQKLQMQVRGVGLKYLANDEWVNSPIQLSNNKQIYQFTPLNELDLFLLPADDDWRVIKNGNIYPLELKNNIPDRHNYVTTTFLDTNQIVLGSSNGLLTFLNLDTQEVFSFQLTNDWISKIIKNNNTLIVLTEFKIFYIEWPSPIRILGRENGLSSSIYDLSRWNENNYVSSTSGVFIEDRTNPISTSQMFKKLDWTSNEVWNLLPIDENKALLSESYKLLLIDHTKKEKVTILSDIIYPRELVQSNYNPEIFFIITEFDLRILSLNENDWEINIVFDSRPISLVESKSGLLMLSNEEGEIFEISFNSENGTVNSTNNITHKFDLEFSELAGLKFLNDSENIYAFNAKNIYKYEKSQFKKLSFPSLDALLNIEELKGLIINEKGKLYGYTLFKFLYQDSENQWQSIDLSPFLRGIIDRIKLFEDGIKILSSGKIITYLFNKSISTEKNNLKLLMSSVVYKDESSQQYLPLISDKEFKYEQGNKSMTFSYTLNDFIHLDKTQYRYRLNENQWSEYFSDNKIMFNNLPADQYRFEIEAKDSNENTYVLQSYHFSVLPVWYLTPLAALIWGILLIATVYVLLIFFLKWRENLHIVQKLELKKTIESKTIELKKANDELQKMVHQDGLTGLSNRLYLKEFIDNVINQSIDSITVMMLDMDYFKQYNDTNGHIAGDDLLKLLAHHLKNEINGTDDLVARYGGEEFIIILINSNDNYVKTKAEKIRSLIEDVENKISISIGICRSTDKKSLTNITFIEELINCADKALYQAKKSGKNQVCIY